MIHNIIYRPQYYINLYGGNIANKYFKGAQIFTLLINIKISQITITMATYYLIKEHSKQIDKPTCFT